jgi:hypothetical protein
MQLAQVDASASRSHCRAFESSSYLTDFFDIRLGDTTHHRAAVGFNVDNANALQRHKRFANRSGTHSITLGEVMNHKMLTSLETALKDVRQQRVRDYLSPLTMINSLGLCSSTAFRNDCGDHSSGSRNECHVLRWFAVPT